MEHKRWGVLIWHKTRVWGTCLLFWGVVFTQSPFQVSLFGQTRPSPITVQSGWTKLAHWQHTPTWPPFSATLSCGPGATKSQPSKGTKPSAYSFLPQSFPQEEKTIERFPGGNNWQHLRGWDSPQGGGCSQYLYLCRRNGPHLARRRGRSDSAIMRRTARSALWAFSWFCPDGKCSYRWGATWLLGSPARLPHREEGSSCKHIKQKMEWFMGRGTSHPDPMFSTHVDSQGSHLSNL